MNKSFLLLAVMGFICILNDKPQAQAPGWLWATSAWGTKQEEGYSVAADAQGDVYVTGFFDSYVIIFGSYDHFLYNPGNSDMFLVKYDNNGNVI